jgi:hypothetical protein
LIDSFAVTHFETLESSNNIVLEAAEYQEPSLLLSAAPSFGGGASFETLDFSLPSYSEANGGDSKAAEPKSAPSFPELKIPGIEAKEEVKEDSKDSAVDEEAAKKKAEEEKAAAKKKAEEEKAAAKKAAEEEKAAKAKVC